VQEVQPDRREAARDGRAGEWGRLGPGVRLSFTNKTSQAWPVPHGVRGSGRTRRCPQTVAAASGGNSPPRGDALRKGRGHVSDPARRVKTWGSLLLESLGPRSLLEQSCGVRLA
jgi:hypothetical protein